MASEVEEREAGEREDGAEKLSFSQVRSAVLERETNEMKERRNFIARMRYLYRTGRWAKTVTSSDLQRDFLHYDKFGADSTSTVNLAIPYLDVLVETTAAQIPAFAVEPGEQGEDAQRAAVLQERYTKSMWDHLHVQNTLRRMGFDAAQSGDGWCHVEWLFEEEEVPEDERRALAMDAVLEAVNSGQMPAYVDRDQLFQTALAQVPKTRTTKNEPRVLYVSPLDVIIPPHVSDIEDAQWYCLRLAVNIREARENEEWDAEARKRLRPRGEADENRRTDGTTVNGADDLDGVVHIYKVYVRDENRLIVFAEGAKRPLFDGENPYDIGELCLVHLRYRRDGENLHGIPDLELIAASVANIQELTDEQIANAKRMRPLAFINTAGLSETDRKTIAAAREGVLNPLESLPPGETLAGRIESLEAPPLNAEVFAARDTQIGDIGRILGLSDLQVGGLGPSRMPGTAAAVSDGNSQIRSQGRRDAYEACASRIADLILKLAQRYLDEPTVVSILGPDGLLWQETVDREKLSGGFYVQVKPGSMSASNPATRANRAMEMLTQTIPQLDAKGYNTDGLTRIALRDLGIDPDAAKLTREPPAPAPGPAGGGGQMPMPGEMTGQDEMAALGAPPLPDGGAGPLL